MRHQALGLVEVRGYLGAVAVADAALKAAAVTCIGVEVIKGGLVTVKLGGDVGAVQAAVDAGAEQAVQLDVLVARHVIARLHEETAALVAGKEEDQQEAEQTKQTKKAEMPQAESSTAQQADEKKAAAMPESAIEAKAHDKKAILAEDTAEGKALLESTQKSPASSEASHIPAEDAVKPVDAARSAMDAMQRVAKEAAKLVEEARKADEEAQAAKDEGSKPRVKPPKAPSAAKKRSKDTKKA